MLEESSSYYTMQDPESVTLTPEPHPCHPNQSHKRQTDENDKVKLKALEADMALNQNAKSRCLAVSSLLCLTKPKTAKHSPVAPRSFAPRKSQRSILDRSRIHRRCCWGPSLLVTEREPGTQLSRSAPKRYIQRLGAWQ